MRASLRLSPGAMIFHVGLAGVAEPNDAQENRMSLVNGDKARVNRLRRKKIQLRLRTRKLMEDSGKPAEAGKKGSAK